LTKYCPETFWKIFRTKYKSKFHTCYQN
jgi:hypothetical protein